MCNKSAFRINFEDKKTDENFVSEYKDLKKWSDGG